MNLVKFVAPFTFPDLEICSLKQIYFSQFSFIAIEQWALQAKPICDQVNYNPDCWLYVLKPIVMYSMPILFYDVSSLAI